MKPQETVQVESTTVACNGGGGSLGHPRVWLNMGDKHKVDCPYCGRRFVHDNGHGDGAPGVYEVSGGH